MTKVQRTNSALVIAVMVISLTIHLLFLTFFSLGRTAAGYDFAADEFFQVHSVVIEDTQYGQDPQMHVERTIVQDFPGTWIARVATEDGEWVCGNEGSSPYRTDARLPDSIGLFDFWLFIDTEQPGQYCRDGYYPLPVGCYIVDTTWEVHDERVEPPRLVHARSNRFCVTEE